MGRKLTQEEAIERHKGIHGEKYSYHLAVYKGALTKWELWCNTCQKSFWQTPDKGINKKQGCNVCGYLHSSLKNTHSQEQVIQSHKDIHGDKYSYHLVEYINSQIKWKLWCNTCQKSFWQRPNDGINNKVGCPYCYGNAKLTTEQSIQKHKAIHGDNFSYHLAVYVNTLTKWELWCNTCEKSFWQTPGNGISKKCGCPYCNISVIERQVQEYIKSIYHGKIIFNTYDIIPPYECDIYLPAINLVIEINGCYWHMNPTKYLPFDFNDTTNKSAQQINDKDKLKRQMLKDKGIRLLSIWERQYHNNTTDMERIIFNAIYSITDTRYTFNPQARELFNINL